MRRLIIPFVGLLTLLPMVYGGCGGSGDSPTGSTLFFASKTFSFEISAGSKSALAVSGVNGLIDVNGTAPAATITISGEMKVGSPTLQDARDHLVDLDVVITDGSTEVKARTTQPSASDGRNYIVDYYIVVPEAYLVDVSQANGEIVLSDLSGNITARLANGSMDVTAEVLPGGTIDMSGANMDAVLTVPTSTSAALSLSTATGSLSTSNLTITGKTETPFSLTGTLGTGDGQIRISNANGSILVTGAP